MKNARHSFVVAIVKTWWLWPILAILTTYLLIMVMSIGQSIWFDEGYSILLAKRPVGELIALTGVDAHPPFYYLLLKAWAGIFGWSEFALRSLSAIAASLTVGVVFLLVRRLFTVRTALVALPFLVLAPFALRYGYEIRMYALAALIGALASLVLVHAADGKSKKLWIVYALLVALGMFTLYMTAAIWLAHVVWLFFSTKRSKQSAFFKQPWVLSYVGAIILFAAYIPTLFYQLTHSALPGIGGSITLTKLADISGVLLVFTPEWHLTSIVSLAILAVVVLTVCLLVAIRHALAKSERLNLWFVIALVVVPMVFFTLTSLAKPIFVDRYMAHIAIYVYMLIGVTVALGWRYGRRMMAGSLAAISLVLLFFGVLQLQQTGNFIFERLQHPQTMQLRSDITCNNATTIVADDPYTYIDTNYYFSGCDLRFFSENPIQKQGGYAPLFDSTVRVTSSNEITAKNLIRLGWDGATPSFKVDARYELVSSKTYEKQVVDYYTLK
jgi:uncharacterized membrane protein